MITFTEAQVNNNLSALKAAIIAAVPGFPAGTSAENNSQNVRNFAEDQSTSTNLTSVLDYQKEVVTPGVPANDLFHVRVRFLYVDSLNDGVDHIDALLLFSRVELTTP